MITIPGYRTGEIIYQGDRSKVIQAERIADGESVVLKLPATDYPSEHERSHFRAEFEILQLVEGKGILKVLALEETHHTLALVLEDFGGHSLAALMANGWKLHVGPFLDLAIDLVNALARVHSAGVIHKDVNPTNILFNPRTGILKLIDFGISSRLSRENPVALSPEGLEGTLAYLSPEQTGRMNRMVDYRTDFYALGTTFYHLLALCLPFEAEDALGLVHCHLAQTPIPLWQHNKAVPESLCAVVEKLMAKAAEDRYQSSYGLLADLEENQRRWSASTPVKPFVAGCNDVAERLQLPHKLYGRAEELAILLSAFDRISGKRESGLGQIGSVELALVTGSAGVGKSSLIRELAKPMVGRKCSFISGKFDQFNRNIPHLALIGAVEEWVRQLLTEPQAILDDWSVRIATAVGNNARYLLEVFPSLIHLIGDLPAALVTDDQETLHRFRAGFLELVKLACRPDHPLVIYLDDLQWADPASLALIQALLCDQSQSHLLVIGACRDDEVDGAHPLSVTLKEVSAKITTHIIELGPLELAQVRCFLTETLSRDDEEIDELAKLVHAKTGGNAFFCLSFLEALDKDKLLLFNSAERRWTWNMAEIAERDITDNVVELVAARLRDFPPKVIEVLWTTACLGTDFETETLSLLISETQAALITVQEAGLLFAVKTDRRSGPNINHYRFSHDRIRQAAYSLAPEDKRASLHHRIGRALQLHLSAEALSLRLFEVVDHLNDGRALIPPGGETNDLARLNLEAGGKALSSTAYEAARNYFRVGISLISNCDEHHQMSFQLKRELARAEFLCGDYAASESIIAGLQAHSRTPLEKTRCAYLLIQQYTLTGRYADAIAEALRGLANVGLVLPEKTTPELLGAAMAQVVRDLGPRSIESLALAEETEHPEHRAVFALVSNVGAALFLTNSPLWQLMIAKTVSFALRHGVVSESAYAFICYGMMLSIGKAYRKGYAFGMAAFHLAERFEDGKQKARAAMMLTSSVIHWVRPFTDTDEVLAEGYSAAIASGDLQFAGYLLYIYITIPFHRGVALARIENDLNGYRPFLERTQNRVVLDSFQAYHLTLVALGVVPKKGEPTAEPVDESAFLQAWREAGSMPAVAAYNILNLQVHYLMREPEKALVFARRSEPLKIYIAGNFAIAIHCFYYALCLLAVRDSDHDVEDNEALLTQLRAQLKSWAELNPENFACFHYLVTAEVNSLDGDFWSATMAYKDALHAARSGGFLQNEALSHELTGRFWLARGRKRYAAIHLMDACSGYGRWGAQKKVSQLLQEFPDLAAQPAAVINRMSTTSTNPIRTSTLPFPISPHQLDWDTVIKAVRAISGEIDLDRLMARLMTLLMENAGAQKSFLVLHSGEGWRIEASALIGESGVLVSMDRHRIDGTLLPASMVRYVARTGEHVLLPGSIHADTFHDDPYLREHAPESVLCISLRQKDSVDGVLYLENNRIAGAFTEDRLEVIQILLAQAAISLENAFLYRDLHKEMAQRALTQEALHESEARFSLFMRHLPGLAYMKDENYRLVFMNGALKTRLGLASDTQEEISAADLLEAETGNLWNANDALVLSGGEPIEVIESYSQNDQISQYLCTKFPIPGPDGSRFVGAVAIDITELQRTREALQKANDELEMRVEQRTAALRAANRELENTNREILRTQSQLIVQEKMASLGTLAAGISHEIRNPLNFIENLSQVMVELSAELENLLRPLRANLGERLFAEIRDILTDLKRNGDVVHKHGTRAERIIHSLTEMAESGSGHRQKANINPLVQQYVELGIKGLKMERIQLNLDLDGKVGETEVEARNLGRALILLLKNAADAVLARDRRDQGTYKPLIEVTTRDLEKCIAITVSDNGLGILPEHLPQILNPFFSTKPPGMHIGLGLTIAYDIVVSEHGGELEIDAKPGADTRFRMLLPKLGNAPIEA